MSTTPRRSAANPTAEPPFRISTINAILLVMAVLTIALGYFLLAHASHSSAPILLSVGYAIFLPLAIIL
jgi:hypothetical protein